MSVPSPSAILFSFVLLLTASSHGASLEELRTDPAMNPARFAAHFRDFDFVFRADVQKPEVFLKRKSGDCDDYSILAAEILKERGYTARLIAIRMPKIVHVVCYVDETGSYLDYNQRRSGGLVSSGGEIAEIAASVARSYGEKWSSASEFTYADGAKRLVRTVSRPRDEEPPRTSIFAKNHQQPAVSKP